MIQSHDSEECLKELADVLEVIHALSNAMDLSIEQVEEKRIEKLQQKGGFEGKMFNHHVDIDEDNPAITYLSQVKRYPQLNHQIHKQHCLFCEIASGKKAMIPYATFQHSLFDQGSISLFLLGTCSLFPMNIQIIGLLRLTKCASIS